MNCPRCDKPITYGVAACPYCGLRFKYRTERTSRRSPCKKTTAILLAYLCGFVGGHNFYLGYFWRGMLRVVVFIIFCGSFIVPQASSLLTSGRLALAADYQTVMGIISLLAMCASSLLAGCERIWLASGTIAADAEGREIK